MIQKSTVRNSGGLVSLSTPGAAAAPQVLGVWYET